MAAEKPYDKEQEGNGPNKGRRKFLKQSSLLTALAVAPPYLVKAAASELDEKAAAYFEQVPLSIEVNGIGHKLSIEPRVTLLDLLREQLALPGTKKGCDHGQCGACTVHVDGRRVLSCMSLAVMQEGKTVTTIEGLANGDQLHPMQEAFIKHDGFQCGYCTPGQIMSGIACINEGHANSDDEIREYMSGNICRCGAYPNIVKAVADVKKGGAEAMINFDYIRVTTPKAAVDALSKDSSAQWIAGGTNLIDLMKKGVTAPKKLIDITNLALKDVKKEGSRLYIGALALNSDVADSELVQKEQPLLALALKAGASQQLRNMATVGGNMMQRTRCPYFYNPDMPCNKREPGTGCGALKGFNRMHAIFGASDKCIAVHPSDMCIALVALDAMVRVTGPEGDRLIPFQNFHRLPGELPQKDNTLDRGELIVAVEIPDNPFRKNVHYLKVRDRTSYAFALVSVAAALNIEGGKISDVRLGMGGVAHKPWRLTEAEGFLKGKAASEAVFQEAAQVAMRGAKGFGHNNFKLKLGPNTIVEALKTATGKS